MQPETPPAAGSRGQKIRGALVTVFVSRYATQGINFAAMVLLAHLIPPAETGLFSVAASIVLLAQAVRDFGIAEFLMQERDLTSYKIRTAFGMTLILSWALGVLVFLSRHLIADFYNTPELGDLIVIVTGCFIVAPFSSTVMALLNREMAFGTLFRISLAATIVNQAVAIVLAFMGFGAAALTAGMLAANTTTAVVASLSLRSWDHVIPSLREWRALASFGAYISSANIVDQIGLRAPDLIIGRLIGYQALGLFNRANGIISLVANMVLTGAHTVATPVFSSAHRAGEDLHHAYLQIVALMSGVILPMLAMLAIVAHPLVSVLLGPTWTATAPLVPLLCLGFVPDALTPMVVSFMNATGRVSTTLRIALSLRCVQLVLVCALASFGIMWLAIGQGVLGGVTVVVNAHFLRQSIRIRFVELLHAIQRSSFVTLMSAVPPLVLVQLRADLSDPAWIVLGYAGLAGGIGWISGIVITAHPLRGELLGAMRMMLGRVQRGNSS